jgi:phosphotransferase family enzyme
MAWPAAGVGISSWLGWSRWRSVGSAAGSARLLGMVGDLDRRALAAAGAVAAAYGLAPDDAVVIHSGSNVLVHLRPAPVVARVMTGTVVLHDDLSRWLKREISVLEFLAPSGLAVAPSPLIGPGPHHRDGLWMTFLEWIPGVEPVTQLDDAYRLGRALRDLHDELRRFGGDLGDLRAVREDIERLHGQLRPADAHEVDVVSSLRVRLDALGEVVFESTLPSQALHGDISLSNLLRTPQRLVWNDFEDTFRGPVHWDVASYVESLRIRGAGSSFVREMLDAYGWDREQDLAPFIAAQDVYVEIWQMYDRQRRRSHEPRSQAKPLRFLDRPPSS